MRQGGGVGRGVAAPAAIVRASSKGTAHSRDSHRFSRSLIAIGGHDGGRVQNEASDDRAPARYEGLRGPRAPAPGVGAWTRLFGECKTANVRATQNAGFQRARPFAGS